MNIEKIKEIYNIDETEDTYKSIAEGEVELKKAITQNKKAQIAYKKLRATYLKQILALQTKYPIEIENDYTKLELLKEEVILNLQTKEDNILFSIASKKTGKTLFCFHITKDKFTETVDNYYNTENQRYKNQTKDIDRQQAYIAKVCKDVTKRLYKGSDSIFGSYKEEVSLIDYYILKNYIAYKDQYTDYENFEESFKMEMNR